VLSIIDGLAAADDGNMPLHLTAKPFFQQFHSVGGPR
jgi:hypothetical protein